MTPLVLGLVGIAITMVLQIAAFAYWTGKQSMRLETVEEQLRLEKADRAKDIDRMRYESSSSITMTDHARDKRIENLEAQIRDLKTDFSDRLDRGFAKLEGVMSAFSKGLHDQAVSLNELRARTSERARAMPPRDPRRE